ncbi:MAG: MscL family protein [Candidatus Saccharimonadales bacterium]
MAKAPKKSGVKVTKKVTKKVKSSAKSELEGFVDFIRTQGIIGLAIGFVMGTQAKQLIDQMSRSFIDPILGLLIGGSKSLSEKSVYVQINSRSATFAWGAFVYAVINFLIIAGVIYFTFKWLHLDKLDKKKS